MARNVLIFALYIAFLALGIGAPFVFSLGYVWVDAFDPQEVAPEYLSQIPVSLIMALAALGGYVLLDKRKVRVTPTTILLVVFAIWVTVTTAFWAEVPGAAWVKWNYAFKTICFAAFVPFVFRSRIQIEAFLQVYLFAIMVHFLPVGLKTMISGGGYGRSLGVIGGNSLLAEGSTLSGVALMLVPIILYLRGNTTIVPKGRLSNLIYAGLAVVAIAGAAGTYERTALIGMVVVGVGLWFRSRRKLLHGAVGAIVVIVAVAFSSDAWNSRISTVKDFNTEGSALGRILVWKWTLGYVADHPLGGGFNVFMIDQIEFPAAPDAPPVIVKGKAFHSIYFEVLGEQGWVGLGIFAALIAGSLFQLQTVARLTRRIDEMAWASELAHALQIAIATLLACGSFVGIAFQPMLYYLFAISACLRAHVRQVQRSGAMPTPAPVLRRRQAMAGIAVEDAF